MSKKEQPAPDFTGDEHWGKGGWYVVIDGKRVPAPVQPDETPAPTEQPVTKGN